MALKTYIIQGKAKWAKILGEPRPGFDEGSKEWSIDVILDEENKKILLESGADKFYLKTNQDGEELVRFVRKAKRADGTDANPVSVEDDHGNPWNPEKLIGNGSVINCKYFLNEVRSKGVKRLKPSLIAVQVWDHQPFKPSTSFFKTKRTEEMGTQAQAETSDAGEEW